MSTDKPSLPEVLAIFFLQLLSVQWKGVVRPIIFLFYSLWCGPITGVLFLSIMLFLQVFLLLPPYMPCELVMMLCVLAAYAFRMITSYCYGEVMSCLFG